MNIDPFGLTSLGNDLKPQILRAVSRVIDSGTFILGPEVEAFEREFAEYIGTKECVLVANGLDALHLTLAAMGIGAGDEVIVPSQTFLATLVAPLRLGAIVVAVDVDPITGLIDPNKVSQAIGPRSSAIVPVHLHGAVADMEVLRTLADRHGLALIEDAAQSHGARTSKGMAGSLGHAGAFSFYPTKNLGALGDAGCVTTDDTHLAANIRSMRNYYRSSFSGSLPALATNSRTDAIQAAILRETLPKLSQWNEQRRALACDYQEALRDNPLSLLCASQTIGPSNVVHHFALLVPNREEVVERFASIGLQVISHYSPLPNDVLKSRFRKGNLSHIVVHSDHGARLNAKHTVSLPMHPFLETEEVLQIAHKLIEFVDMDSSQSLFDQICGQSWKGRVT